MLISVVLPCYNEEKVLTLTYSELSAQMKKITDDYEMIFVDDGSRDNTRALLKQFAEGDSHVRYISFSRNFGKESAMLAGLRYSSGDFTVIMDSDLQHPPELIAQMLEYGRQGYDQVIAQRNRDGDKMLGSFFARTYYRLVDRLTDVELTDGIGDFRMLSRKALNALLTMNEYNRFSKGLFSWIGFKEKIIKYQNRSRAAGESKWSFRSLVRYGVDGVLSFNNKPLRFCIFIGAFAIIISLLYVMFLFFGIVFKGIDLPGYFTTIFTICFFGGVQLFSLGIVGEYVGRIYYEVKRRPHYLIDETNLSQKENQ